jgi:hypothetical protein
MNSQRDDPPNDTEQPPPPPSDNALADAAKVLELEDQLRAAVAELLKAEDAKIPRLMNKIQRLRLSLQMMKELLNGEPSDGVYKELVLLQRMIKGAGPDLGGDTDAEAEVARETELKQLNLDATSAHRLVKLFERMTPDVDDTESGIPADFEPPDD